MYHSKGLAPKPARLRVTWIHHFMHSGIADELICLAAGIKTLAVTNTYVPSTTTQLQRSAPGSTVLTEVSTVSKWPAWFEGGEVRKPKTVPDQAWESVRDRVEQAAIAVREQEPTKIGEPYAFINAVTKVVLAADQDEALESIFADERMAELVAQLGVRAAERRALVAVKHALDPYAQQVAPSITRSPAEKPYTDKEIQTVLDWANYKQKAPLPRYKALVVALGFGAGLRGTEMDELTWTQISVDELGCVIHMPDRDVPVLRRFEQALIDLPPQTEAEIDE